METSNDIQELSASVVSTTDGGGAGGGYGGGRALIREEFILKKREREEDEEREETSGTVPEKVEGGDQTEGEPHHKRRHDSDGGEREKRERKRGGVNRKRAITQTLESTLCLSAACGDPCRFGEDSCRRSHDVIGYFLHHRKPDLVPALPAESMTDDRGLLSAPSKPTCPYSTRHQTCQYGLLCRVGSDHLDEKGMNIRHSGEDGESETEKVQPLMNVAHRDLLNALQKKKVEFSLPSGVGEYAGIENARERLSRMKRRQIEWKNKLILSPLATVGNVPFRRICIEYGADVTCSEMVLGMKMLQGKQSEWALMRRHPSERCFGIQVVVGNPEQAQRAGILLEEYLQAKAIGATFGDEKEEEGEGEGDAKRGGRELETTGFDFVELNCGCPIDLLWRQGLGAALPTRISRFEKVTSALARNLKSVPLSVKTRMGASQGHLYAEDVLRACQKISLATGNSIQSMVLHGRTRSQRYTKLADWGFIRNIQTIGDSLGIDVIGNGDVFLPEDAIETGGFNTPDRRSVMIGRGALIKPWIFDEIRENRLIDMRSSQRLDIMKKFVSYGFETWGSDDKGVETTRRFLLEWCSFLYRYIPLGILEKPARMYDRPPRFCGRDDLETLMASSYVGDWIKLSEMLLGPVPDGFTFTPKHGSNEAQ
jgi:tRNA-dihydrouridine synthase 3